MISNLRKSIFFLQQAILEEANKDIDNELLKILEKLADLVLRENKQDNENTKE